MEKVRMGVIGIGNMGSAHAKSIADGIISGMVLSAIADISPERLEWASQNLPKGIALFNDADNLIKSGLVDAIIVSTPHYYHPPLAIKGFENGLHVLIEKPAGVYTMQVRQMNEIAEKSGKVFAMMFNQRTNCIFRKMKEIVSSGELGRIKRTNWIITDWYRSQSYYDSGSWRATWAGEGGGVLLNQCPHNLDLWQWICGMPSKIQAFCHEGKWHDIEVEDDVTAYAEYPNGATGVFVTSTADTPGTNRFEIMLDGGKLVCENNKLMLYKLEMREREFNATYKKGFGQPEFEKIDVETDGENPQHNGVLQNFADAILFDKPLIASGCEGIHGLSISNAMHLSSWLGRAVEMPLNEELFFNELTKKIASSKRKNVVSGEVLNIEGTFGS
jgi:predicted dehydrogenase